MNVHIYKDDQQPGPYSLEQIQTMLQEGTLATDDLARVDDSGAYMPLGNVPDLISGSALSNDPGTPATSSPD